MSKFTILNVKDFYFHSTVKILLSQKMVHYIILKRINCTCDWCEEVNVNQIIFKNQ